MVNSAANFVSSSFNFSLLFLLGLIFFTPSPSRGGSEWVRGLNGVPLDQWTHLLHAQSQGHTKAQTVHEVSQFGTYLLNWLFDYKSEHELYDKIEKFFWSARLSTPGDFAALAYQLLAAREALRFIPIRDPKQGITLRRDTLYLLLTLAEETLFVANDRWPQKVGKQIGGKPYFEILFQDYANLGYPERSASLPGRLMIQTSDVLLSKASGYGSSVFISSVAQSPSAFSHSAMAWVPEGANTVSLVESLMEDGTKLRYFDPEGYGNKTRLAVFRHKDAQKTREHPVQILGPVDDFVREMYRISPDPYKQASYHYDISMSPDQWSGKRYFCSAVSYDAFRRYGTTYGLNSLANPYPKPFWSEIVGGRQLLLRILEITSRSIPAPGDIELNPEWGLVGLRIHLDQLSQERLEAAAVESFLKYLENSRPILQKIEKNLDHVGEETLSREQLLGLINQSWVPLEFRDQLRIKANDIPESANIKQLAFFFFINEVLTPALREQLFQHHTYARKRGKLVGPIELRRQASKRIKTLIDMNFQKYFEWIRILDHASRSLRPVGAHRNPACRNIFSGLLISS